LECEHPRGVGERKKALERAKKRVLSFTLSD